MAAGVGVMKIQTRRTDIIGYNFKVLTWLQSHAQASQCHRLDGPAVMCYSRGDGRPWYRFSEHYYLDGYRWWGSVADYWNEVTRRNLVAVVDKWV